MTRARSASGRMLRGIGVVVALAGSWSLVDAAPWTARYEGPGRDAPVAVALDESTNVYVAGSSEGASTASDVLILKYTPAGVLAWTLRYDHGPNRQDVVQSFGIAPDGSVYVVGTTAEPDGEPDAIALKCDRNGALQWVRTLDGGGRDFFDVVAITSDGGIVAGGATYVAGQGLDLVVRKYAPTGTPSWTWTWDGARHGTDMATGIAPLGSNEVAVAGIEADSTGFGDWVVTRLSGTGDSVWVRRYNGPGDEEDWPFAMAVDGSGRIVVTGVSVGATSGDVLTRVYTGSGALDWSAVHDGALGEVDIGEALHIDAAGNVYVGGVSNAETNPDHLALKYGSTGSLEWARRYDGTPVGIDEATDIVMNADGVIAVTGYGRSAADLEDFVTCAYGGAGGTIRRWFYDGPASGEDRAAGIAAVPDGFVVVGVSEGIGTGPDFAITKVDTTTGVTSVPGSKPPAVLFVGLRSANPTTGAIALDLELPVAGTASVTFYDVNGRRVGGGIGSAPYGAGSHRIRLDVSALHGGIYWVRAEGRSGERRFDEKWKVALVP